PSSASASGCSRKPPATAAASAARREGTASSAEAILGGAQARKTLGPHVRGRILPPIPLTHALAVHAQERVVAQFVRQGDGQGGQLPRPQACDLRAALGKALVAGLDHAGKAAIGFGVFVG